MYFKDNISVKENNDIDKAHLRLGKRNEHLLCETPTL